MQGLNLSQPGLKYDPNWFKTAVFYEVLVRAFADSTGNGSGDFGGLIGKLDYLAWLGVDALWIPPFYASPLRDGGYDIADYTAVLPEFGTLVDFTELVSQAHARGIRIITDLVMNHTSDQHPWFQASRSDPQGPYGDFYVWSDDDTKYGDARIIFIDTEVSNWTFDPVRRQFFWHRFFSHQPDLNFENEAVAQAMFDVVRFWMDLGIDGFRLDAVPYLFEEEGHNGENHPKTHAFLARLRAMVDQEYPGRILLAEANQMPHEVVDYFGTTETPECQMCFHFPVMPRLYASLREEKSTPIRRALEDTPPIPSGTQWGTFLRNHDELTLEMVTPEERSAMYGWYAPDPRMRANVGIRRRLATLLDNSRVELELIHALVLSLPGSPCLYYGDEMGMGDNIWLPDRDAVRTPMQWTPDRNAGFSSSDPGKLYLPVIQSLVYHHNNVNVEAQMAHGSSLLHWVRAMLHVRARHPVFGLGTFELLRCDNDTLLSFLRDLTADESPDGVDGAESVLCMMNLSSRSQTGVVTLPPRFAGARMRDLFGGSWFPSVGADGTVTLSLGSRDFYWLKVEALPEGTVLAAAPTSTVEPVEAVQRTPRTAVVGSTAGARQPIGLEEPETVGPQESSQTVDAAGPDPSVESALPAAPSDAVAGRTSSRKSTSARNTNRNTKTPAKKTTAERASRPSKGDADG